MESSITADLITVFEEDQRKVVFSALSDYLHLGLFTDVSLICGLQMVRAHKVVLAASSKFFRDSFKHCPNLTAVDLDKELAPHGLALTFDDVQLIIGILYCVGTVEISSQRIESLLLIAQVMGIPSLIAFLKRVRESVIVSNTFPHVSDRLVGNSNTQFSPLKRLVSLHHQSSSPNSQALVYLFPPSTSVVLDQSGSNGLGNDQSGFIPVSSSFPGSSSISSELYRKQSTSSSGGNEFSLSNSFHNSLLTQERTINSREMKLHSSQSFGSKDELVSGDQQRLLLTPQSRSVSRATLASLGSFSLNPIASPALRESGDVTCGSVTTNPIKGVTSVLDGFDPSFLSQFNNLQATQIDDLENALLPHLDGNGGDGGSKHSDGHPDNDRDDDNRSQFLDDDNLGNLSDGDLADSFNSDEPSKIELTKQELSQLQIVTHGMNNSGSIHVDQEPTTSSNAEPPKGSSTPVRKTNEISIHEKSSTSDIQKSLELTKKVPEDSTSDFGELIPIDPGFSSSVKLAIPGTSNSMTLNFPADVLDQMRMAVMESEDSTECETVTSSTTTTTVSDLRDVRHRRRERKKERKRKQKVESPKPFSCQLCRKAFSKRRLLEKHLAFHVEENRPCQVCGKVFEKRWMLQQHLAVDHGNSKELECKECGKTFKWPRNLLAHMAITHQREIRYRCRLCPLTFLRKKSYIKHHQGKHPDSPETWCKFCFEIFENMKQRDDHHCDRVENTGRVTICHRHPNPIVFRHQQELNDHLKEHHQIGQETDDVVDLPQIQKSCPVCHKKFLLKKNLLTHLKRIHESEGKGTRFQCTQCPKSFYYESDRLSHENTHKTGDGSSSSLKQFPCESCDKSYSSLKALKDHKKNVHAEIKQVHSCKTCGKVLSDKYKLKYHIKLVHSDKKNFKCNHCHVQFKGRENLGKHLKKFHGTAGEGEPKLPAEVENCQPPVVDPDKAEDEESDSFCSGNPESFVPSKVLSFNDL